MLVRKPDLEITPDHHVMLGPRMRTFEAQTPELPDKLPTEDRLYL